jgi:hypothetical protein
MFPMTLQLRPVALAALIALLPRPAAAWDEMVHQQLTAAAVASWPAAPVTDTSAGSVLVDWGRDLACAARPWPWHAAGATAAALIAFGWNDALASPPWQAPRLAVHAADLVILGSSAPDQDGRNQDRLARDAAGRPLVDVKGAVLAIDPLVRQYGGSTGLGSQAHAHYALPPRTKAGLWAWWLRPAAAGWDLAGLGRLESEAAAQAEIHTAAALRLRASDPRAAAWLIGGALHYLQDAADPLHNVQAGPRSGLVHALLGALLGGQSPVAAGMASLRNLHLGAEALQAAWLFGAGPSAGQATFTAARSAAVEQARFPALGPSAWVDMLAVAGAREGLIAYDRMGLVIRAEYARGLTDVGESLDAVAGWRRILRDEPDPQAIRELAEVLGRATGRAEAATHTLVGRWLRGSLVASDRVVADRLTAQQARWATVHGADWPAAPMPWCDTSSAVRAQP